MNRYLIFDSRCSACSSLARAIEEGVTRKLDVVDISSEQAKELLDQVFPNGWEYQPYLVIVNQNEVSALTGYKMALQIGMLLGPKKSWQVYSLAKQYKVKISSGGQIRSRSKRKFLINSAIFGGTLFSIGSGFPNFRSLIAQSQNNYDFEPKLYMWPREAAKALRLTATGSKDYENFKSELRSDCVEGEPIVFLRESNTMFVSIPFTELKNKKSASFTNVVTSNQSEQESIATMLEDTPGGHRGRLWHNGRLVLDISVNDQGTVTNDEMFKVGLSQTNLSGQNLVAQGQAIFKKFIRQLRKNWEAPQTNSFLDSNRANAISFSCVNNCLASQGIAGWSATILGAACGIACFFTAGLGCIACLAGLIGFGSGVISACVYRCR